MIDINSPLLLIDLGYALFYRYSATQLWYKHSHPEEKDLLTKDYKWCDNTEFMEKMKKMFVIDIFGLAKKNKIPKHNIIIAEDCRLKDNWRVSHFSAYKAQRAEERDKNGWQGGPAFEIIIKEVIPEMVKVHDVKLLKHSKIEADDIISQIVIKGGGPPKFIIVASDNDYFQILNNNVELVNMKGVDQKEKMKYSPKGHLIEKILKGDVSDNIKACLFNKKWVYELVPNMGKKSSAEFIKSNKKIIDYYVENPDQLVKDFNHVSSNGEEYIQGYLENKKIISFDELPKEYVLDVHKMYSNLLNLN
jgi:hypothetical protein